MVWNNQAGELWRRTKQAIERHLGQLARRRGVPPIRVPAATASTAWSTRSASRTARPPNTRPAARSTSTPCSASTATTPPTRTGCCPRPPGITIADLDDATRRAASAISYRTPPHPAQPGGWTITWGTEIDIRVITLHGTGTVTDLAVASYLAKYSTKGTEPTGHASARITAETIDLYANPGRHPPRTAHRRLLDDRRRTPATPACAAGRTCSASAATS